MAYKKNKKTIYEACPSCGNEIEVDAHAGDVRKCPWCKRRYIVSSEKRKRKYLECYIKGGNE